MSTTARSNLQLSSTASHTFDPTLRRSKSSSPTSSPASSPWCSSHLSLRPASWSSASSACVSTSSLSGARVRSSMVTPRVTACRYVRFDRVHNATTVVAACTNVQIGRCGPLTRPRASLGSHPYPRPTMSHLLTPSVMTGKPLGVHLKTCIVRNWFILSHCRDGWVPRGDRAGFSHLRNNAARAVGNIRTGSASHKALRVWQHKTNMTMKQTCTLPQ